jgi:thiol-disulfide isomerase/thioredoxin
MGKILKNHVLIVGLLSPVLALVLYAIVYSALTSASSDREHDWLFRLAVSTLAMTVPFIVTVILLLRNGRAGFSLSAKIGLVAAILSLGLAWKPVSDGITRSRQSRNQALRNVVAPPFDTVDLSGKPQRLADHKGEVVLVSLWATWCGPCRTEMPKLDQLYKDRRSRGLMVFGISSEDPDVQRKYAQAIGVSYPLLIVGPGVPSVYQDIARYPAMFLIDRQGRLQPAPNPDEPFEKVTAAVDVLLSESPSSSSAMLQGVLRHDSDTSGKQ